MPKIKVLEEYSSWWVDDCNTCMMAGNHALLKANSRNIIEEEISDLQEDIEFLRKIENIEYNKTWQMYTAQVRQYLASYLQPKPSYELYNGIETQRLDHGIEQRRYPAILTKMDMLIEDTRQEVKTMKNAGYAKQLLKQTLDRLNAIDTEMRENDYTFDGFDTFDLYMEKVEELKVYIARLKGCVD